MPKVPKENGICSLCREPKDKVAFKPCGHFIACKECCILINIEDRKCPMCRSFVTGIFCQRIYGHLDIANYLLDNGANGDSVDLVEFLKDHKDNDEQGLAKVLTKLIGQKADVLIKDQYGNSALHIVSLKGYESIVDILIQNGALVNVTNKHGETPLGLAAKNGHLKILDQFLKNGTDCETIDIFALLKDIQDMDKQIQAMIMKKLITHNGIYLQARDETKNTALHQTSSVGHFELVEFLIEYGAEIDATNSENNTPLNLAFAKGHQSIVDLLLKKGASANLPNLFQAMPKVPEVKGNDSCALCFEPKNEIFAFQPCGHANACKQCCEILTNNEDRSLRKCPICRSYVTDFQKIYIASLSKAMHKAPTDDCNVSVNEQFLKNGTECESIDILTLLKEIHDMDKQEQTIIVEKMMRHGGMNLQVKDEDQNTALHKTSSFGHFELVKLLIENGCEINAANSENDTPLNLAFAKGHQSIVDFLLKKGACVNLPNLFQAMAKVPKDDRCSLCSIEPKNGTFAFQPCGHAIACEQCCVKLTNNEDKSRQKCPICQNCVTYFQRIYV